VDAPISGCRTDKSVSSRDFHNPVVSCKNISQYGPAVAGQRPESRVTVERCRFRRYVRAPESSCRDVPTPRFLERV
jgi:hypothetical protein